MADYETIEIDFDVFRAIQNERRGYDDSPNAALRRLLKLPGKSEQRAASSGRPWIGKGVSLPHGTEVRMDYNGRVFDGVIRDGAWVVEGKEFKSPSAAASSAAITRNGGKTSLDGWVYWSAKRPGDTKWTPISVLRANVPRRI